MSINKNKNQLIIAIIVGIAIAVISHQVIVKLKIENDSLKKLTQTSASAPVKKITYVVAKEDIKKGDKVDLANLTLKQFPIEIEGAISDPSRIAGLNANKDIKADSPIVEDYFKASDIDSSLSEPRSGYRALGTALDAMPPFIQIGAHVDIFFAKNGIHAQDIKILDIVDNAGDGKKYLMLEIKDCDVPAFITAVSNDKAVIIQRNRNEHTGYRFIGGDSYLLAQMPDIDSDYTEVSDVSYSESSASAVQSQGSSSIPIVRARKASEEIELITGDKKVIIGAPR